MLDLSSYRKSLDALERALTVLKQPQTTADPQLLEVVQAGVIQNFEVAYELSWKLLQLWLRKNTSELEAESQQRSKRDLFWAAWKQGLISSVETWEQHLKNRNLSSHTYNEPRAAGIAQAVPAFLDDARALLRALEARNE